MGTILLLVLLAQAEEPLTKEQIDEAAAAAIGQYRIFKWVDARGEAHYADDFDQLPVALRQKYIKRMVEIELERRKRAGAPPAEPPRAVEDGNTSMVLNQDVQAPAVEPADGGKMTEAYWQREAQSLKSQEEEALARVAALEAEIAELSRNLMIAATQPTRGKIAALREQLAKAQAQAQYLHVYRNDVFPETARKLGVPPGWLRLRD